MHVRNGFVSLAYKHDINQFDTAYLMANKIGYCEINIKQTQNRSLFFIMKKDLHTLIKTLQCDTFCFPSAKLFFPAKRSRVAQNLYPPKKLI